MDTNTSTRSLPGTSAKDFHIGQRVVSSFEKEVFSHDNGAELRRGVITALKAGFASFGVAAVVKWDDGWTIPLNSQEISIGWLADEAKWDKDNREPRTKTLLVEIVLREVILDEEDEDDDSAWADEENVYFEDPGALIDSIQDEYQSDEVVSVTLKETK
jgi:hypothetical protein